MGWLRVPEDDAATPYGVSQVTSATMLVLAAGSVLGQDLPLMRPTRETRNDGPEAALYDSDGFSPSATQVHGEEFFIGVANEFTVASQGR